MKLGKSSFICGWPGLSMGYWRHGQKHTLGINLKTMKINHINWGCPEDMYLDGEGNVCLNPTAPKLIRGD